VADYLSLIVKIKSGFDVLNARLSLGLFPPFPHFIKAESMEHSAKRKADSLYHLPNLENEDRKLGDKSVFESSYDLAYQSVFGC